MKLSVWAGKAQLRDPERWVDIIQQAGCERVDLVVNDLSRWRVRQNGKVTNGWYKTSKHWQTYDESKLEAFAKAAVNAGLEVHTLFWAVPTPKGLTSAACWLHTFAETVGVSGHVLDAEEPITQSSYVDYGGNPDEAAEHLFAMIREPLGVTHIGYAPVHTVQPFVSRAAYAIPQTYLTKTSGLTEDSVPRLLARSERKLGAREMVGSFAMYRQPEPDNIKATLCALKACGVKTAIGWHASSLKRYGKALRAANESDA